MAKTAKRLSGPALLTASAVTQYTVPAGTKTIIRHIHFANNSASAANFDTSIGADAVATSIFDGKNIPANDVYDFYCYMVMDVGEILQALASTTNAIVMTVFGDEITLG